MILFLPQFPLSPRGFLLQDARASACRPSDSWCQHGPTHRFVFAMLRVQVRKYHGNLRVQKQCHPPRWLNKGMPPPKKIRPYLTTLGGGIVSVPLDSHDNKWNRWKLWHQPDLAPYQKQRKRKRSSSNPHSFRGKLLVSFGDVYYTFSNKNSGFSCTAKLPVILLCCSPKYFKNPFDTHKISGCEVGIITLHASNLKCVDWTVHLIMKYHENIAQRWDKYPEMRWFCGCAKPGWDKRSHGSCSHLVFLQGF